jgi:hypothetical protein
LLLKEQTFNKFHILEKTAHKIDKYYNYKLINPASPLFADEISYRKICFVDFFITLEIICNLILAFNNIVHPNFLAHNTSENSYFFLKLCP